LRLIIQVKRIKKSEQIRCVNFADGSRQFFEDVPDLRRERKTLYGLPELLLVSFCAVLSGAEDFEEIAEYGVQKLPFLRAFLELPNGTASHDTFNRVFKHLDQASFRNCLYKWSKELLGFLAEKQIAIDGKVLRRLSRRSLARSHPKCCPKPRYLSQNRLAGPLSRAIIPV